jgi:hypothetical protein
VKRVVALLVAALGAGCLTSSVVAPAERDANLGSEALAWAPLDPATATIDGLFASISIEGDASLGLLKLYYHFTPDGAFTGAALLATEPPTFQVLAGRWELGPDGLRLGADSPPARVEVAGDHLRLAGDAGTVVLRRERL